MAGEGHKRVAREGINMWLDKEIKKWINKKIKMW